MSSNLMIKSDQLYNVMKYIAMIVLPAVATLYFALSQIWGLPNGAEVVGTITVVDTFLGVLLRLSTNAYTNSDAKYDGAINIFEDEDTKRFELDLTGDPYLLDTKDEVVFKVNPVDE